MPHSPLKVNRRFEGKLSLSLTVQECAKQEASVTQVVRNASCITLVYYLAYLCLDIFTPELSTSYTAPCTPTVLINDT
jgi:hypothetical protein